MRETKFRARHADVPRCWVYGFIVVEHGCNYIVNDDGKFKVIADTVCLFTGKRDRFDREIYENAIMNWNNGAAKREFRNSLWQVHWDDVHARFSLTLVAGLYTDTPFFVPHWHESMEVIGDTITTPPELLREVQP